MHAKFHSTGRLEIYDNQGDMCIVGRPGTSGDAADYHPMLDYAVELMKSKGDWPDNPFEPQTVELVD